MPRRRSGYEPVARNQSIVACRPVGQVDRLEAREQRAQPGVVGLRVAHVAGPGLDVLDLDGVAEQLLEQGDHAEQVGAGAERQVHRRRRR